MRIWRATYGCDNGCNGQAVEYFASKREAKKVLSQHDESIGGFGSPCVTLIDVSPTKAALLTLLNRETSPLCTK